MNFGYDSFINDDNSSPVRFNRALTLSSKPAEELFKSEDDNILEIKDENLVRKIFKKFKKSQNNMEKFKTFIYWVESKKSFETKKIYQKIKDFSFGSSSTEVSIQEKHEVTCLAFSPDGRVLAVGGDVAFINLYDFATKNLIRQIGTAQNQNFPICLALTEEHLFSGGFDSVITKWDINTGVELDVLSGHAGPVKAIAITHDGNTFVSGGDDKSILIWNLKLMTYQGIYNSHKAPISALILAKDGEELISASRDKLIKIWRVSDQSLLGTLEGSRNRIQAIAISPNGRCLASGDDSRIALWDLETKKLTFCFESESGLITGLGFSKDQSLLVAAGHDKTTKTWNVNKRELKATVELHKDKINCLVVSPDRRIFVTGGKDGKVAISNLDKDYERHLFLGSTDEVFAIATFPNYPYAISSGKDKVVRVWNVIKPRVVKTLEGHAFNVTFLAVSPTGKQFASGDEDGQIFIWESSNFSLLAKYKMHDASVTYLKFGEKNMANLVFSCGQDNKIKIFSSSSGTIELSHNTQPISALDLCSEGNSVVIAFQNQSEIYQFEILKMKVIMTYRFHTKPIKALRIKKGSKNLLSASLDNWIGIWSYDLGHLINKIESSHDLVLLDLLDDNFTIISAHKDNKIRLWDLETGEKLGVSNASECKINAMALSFDSTTLICTGAPNNVLKKVVINKIKTKNTIEHHKSEIYKIAISPNQKLLAVASADNTISIWKIKDKQTSFQFLHSLEGHIKAPTHLSFTKDSKSLLSTGNDKTMRLWDLENFKQKNINKELGGDSNELKIYNNESRILVALDSYSISVFDFKEFKYLDYMGGVYCTCIEFVSETRFFFAEEENPLIHYYDLAEDKFTKLSQCRLNPNGVINCLKYLNKEEKLISAGRDCAINIYKLKNNDLELLEEIKMAHRGSVTSIVVNSSQTKLFSASFDKIINVWDLKNCKKIMTFEGHTDVVNSITISDDEKSLYSGSRDGVVRSWRLRDLRELKFLDGHNSSIVKIAISWKGDFMASLDDNLTLIIWDLKTFIKKHRIEINNFEVNCGDLIFSRNDLQIIVLQPYAIDSIKFIDVETGKVLKTISEINLIEKIFQTFDEKKLILACYDSKIRFYNLEINAFEDQELEEHTGKVTALALTHDGRTLISGGEDYLIIFWDLVSKSYKKKLTGHQGTIVSLVLNFEERLLFSGSKDAKVYVWDLQSFSPIKIIENIDFSIKNLTISPDQQLLFVSIGNRRPNGVWELGNKKSIYVYSLKYNYQLLPNFDEKLGGVNYLEITSDCKTVITAGDDKKIRFWDNSNGKIFRTILGCPNELTAQTATTDGEVIVLAGEDGTIIVWDLKENRKLAYLEGHTARINDLLITSRRTIISAGNDEVIGLWEISEENRVEFLHGHSSGVLAIALINDETELISSGLDLTIRIWNLISKIQTRKFLTGDDIINTIAICGSQSYFYTGGSDKIIKKWSLEQFEDPVTIIKTDDQILQIKFSFDEMILLIKKINGKIQVCSNVTYTVICEISSENKIPMPLFLSKRKNDIMMYYNKVIDCYSGKTIFEFGVNQEILSFFYMKKTGKLVFLMKRGFKLYEVDQDYFSTYFANFLNYDSLISLEKDQKNICDRENSTFPYIFSFLHLIAAFDQSELFTIEKIKEVFGESPFNLIDFCSLDFLNNTPLDILIQKKNTTLIIKYFKLLFEYFNSPETTFYQKTRFLLYDFRPNYCMRDLLCDLVNIIGEDLSIIAELLDNAFIPFDEAIYNNQLVFKELAEPVLIEANSLYIDDKFIEKQLRNTLEPEQNEKEKEKKTKQKSLSQENTSMVKAKILAIPGITDFSKRNTNKFYSKLADLDANQAIFSNKSLGVLVNFIWENQTTFYYRIEFAFFFFFFLIFNVNFAILSYLRGSYVDGVQSVYTLSSELIDVLLFFYAVFCLVNETRQFMGSSDYFKSIWNYFDMALVPLLLFSSFFDFILLYVEAPSYIAYIKLGYGICMFCFWFRFLSFFRGIKETSSMIRLIFNVISGVKYFVLFMILFMLTLTMTMLLLHSETSNGDIPSLWNTFLAFYNSAVGDTSGITDYDLIIPDLAEFFMISSTFLFAIISLNLLVSIIGDKHGENKENEEKTRVFELTNIIVDINSSLLTMIVKKFKSPKTKRYLIQLYNEKHEKKEENDSEINKAKIDRIIETTEMLDAKIDKIIALNGLKKE